MWLSYLNTQFVLCVRYQYFNTAATMSMMKYVKIIPILQTQNWIWGPIPRFQSSYFPHLCTLDTFSQTYARNSALGTQIPSRGRSHSVQEQCGRGSLSHPIHTIFLTWNNLELRFALFLNLTYKTSIHMHPSMRKITNPQDQVKNR